MVKDADNIYYCTKNQVRGLCVGGDMAILFLVCSMGKWPYLRLHTTHALDFSTVIDIAHILYHPKNQVAGLCVSGVSIQPSNLPRTRKITF